MPTDMLIIRHTPGHDAARRWIYDQILGGFLGLRYAVEPAATGEWVEIRTPAGATIAIRDVFFARPERAWCRPETLPELPLVEADLAADAVANAPLSPRVPVLYGSPCASGRWIDRRPSRWEIGIDVLGSAFVMLSRYEEIVDPRRDRYGRFPAAASLASRGGFLERPIVDEYVEVLRHLLVEAGVREAATPAGEFSLRVSHDVDAPYKYLFCDPVLFLKTELAARVRRHDASSLLGNVRTWRRVRSGHLEEDPYNTFAFILAESEARGLQSTFHLIADRPAGWKDGLYDVDAPPIQRLLADIARRGHRIALHGSYNSYDSVEQLRREKARLEAVCDRIGVPTVIDEVRQHYLRFDAGVTPRAWDRAGFAVDTSLTFAQQAGFRCGTSKEYQLFDVRWCEGLRVRERPLLAMDGSLLEYQRLTRAEVLARIEVLATRVARYRGVFTLLWHNSMLATPELRNTYRAVLDVCQAAQQHRATA